MLAALFLTLTVFITLNALGFLLFGIDKQRAVLGGRRLRESTLLNIALLGGWIGCYAGQSTFRHKTRKQPFGAQLMIATTVNVIAIGCLIGWFA